MKQIIVTQKGLKKLQEEYDYLKSVKRQEVVDKIKTALSFGDLSENSEYDEAKNEQAIVESRIVELENMIKNSIVLGKEYMQTEMVDIGSKVEVKNLKRDTVATYIIVSTAEADSTQRKISDESPIGNAMMGRKVGDVVSYEAPSGTMELEILSISIPDEH